MRRATLGAAVISLTGYLAACSDPAPPAGTVHHEAPVVAATDETTVPEASTTTAPPDPEPTTTTAYDWGPVLCKSEPHPRHHEPCPGTRAVAPTTAPSRPSVSRSAPPQTTGTGRCGGNLPPCSVMQRESEGDLTVYNTEGSGASGKWQFMPGTWDGYGGYANAADAPESVQDAKAVETWDGGAGCVHWSAC